MSHRNPNHPPIGAAMGLVQAVIDADPLLDLDDAEVRFFGHDGDAYWLLILRNEVVSCSLKAAVCGGITMRTIDVAVWPVSHAPQPWGGPLRTAVQEHQFRRDVVIAAIDAALPAEAAGWMPTTVEA